MGIVRIEVWPLATSNWFWTTATSSLGPGDPTLAAISSLTARKIDHEAARLAGKHPVCRLTPLQFVAAPVPNGVGCRERLPVVGDGDLPVRLELGPRNSADSKAMLNMWLFSQTFAWARPFASDA